MKKSPFYRLGYCTLLSLLLTVVSCGTQKQAIEAPTTVAVHPQEYLRQFADARVESIPWQGSGTLGIEVPGFSIDVRTDVSFYPGHGFYCSFRPMLFAEVARLYLLPEEIVVIDRYNQRYFRTSYERLGEQLSFPLTYSMVEALLLGEAVRPFEQMLLAEEGEVEVHLSEAPIYLRYSLNDLIRPHRAITMPQFKGVYATMDYDMYADRTPGSLPTGLRLQLFRQGRKQLLLHYVSRSLRRETTAADRLRPEIPPQYREMREDEVKRLLDNLFQK